MAKKPEKEPNKALFSVQEINRIQDEIMNGSLDKEKIEQVFNFLYPDQKDQLYPFNYKRRQVYLYGKEN